MFHLIYSFVAGALTGRQEHQWNIGCAIIRGVRNGEKMVFSESSAVKITTKLNHLSLELGEKAANEGNDFLFAKWNGWGSFKFIRIKRFFYPKFIFPEYGALEIKRVFNKNGLDSCLLCLASLFLSYTVNFEVLVLVILSLLWVLSVIALALDLPEKIPVNFLDSKIFGHEPFTQVSVSGYFIYSPTSLMYVTAALLLLIISMFDFSFCP